MSNDAVSIVQKVWNYCHVLRDDGVSYGDYVEQLTYLIFLKMDHDTGVQYPLPITPSIPSILVSFFYVVSWYVFTLVWWIPLPTFGETHPVAGHGIRPVCFPTLLDPPFQEEEVLLG